MIPNEIEIPAKSDLDENDEDFKSKVIQKNMNVAIQWQISTLRSTRSRIVPELILTF